jgi:hypothetical protein
VVSIDSAIRRFRAKQAGQFSQTALLQRPVGETVYDPNTQASVQPVVTIYTGVPCKVSTMGREQGSEVSAGQTEVRVTDLEAKFPIDADVLHGDLLTIVTSTFNTQDIGRQFRVTQIDRREWQISRKCAIEETIVPVLNEEV